MTMTPTDAWTDRLRAAGLRVTPRRLAVLGALDAHPHSSADEVHEFAAEAATLTRQGVYVMLNEFVERGIVRRITPPGSPSRYETRTDDNHHHLVCDDCGVIHDVDCAVGEAPCLEPGDAAGFEVHTADVTYFGLCPSCRVAAGDPDAVPASHDHHPKH